MELRQIGRLGCGTVLWPCPRLFNASYNSTRVVLSGSEGAVVAHELVTCTAPTNQRRMTANGDEPQQPRPRLCHLIKWADFDGYGFNLHAEKSKSGQFIGQVDADSPAESAGLREGDRIVEVNGVNIAQENHRQVVERIKAIPNETKLLVLDAEADKFYRARKQQVVKQSMPGVIRLKTAIPRPTTITTTVTTELPPPPSSSMHSKTDSPPANIDDEDVDDEADRRSQASSTHNNHVDRKLSSTGSDDKLSHHSSSNHSSPSAGRKDGSLSSNSSSTAPRESPTTLTPPLTPVPRPASPSNSTGNDHSNSNSNGNALNLNMTAQQMRAMLANRKKYDPKKETMDLRKKHAIIQQM